MKKIPWVSFTPMQKEIKKDILKSFESMYDKSIYIIGYSKESNEIKHVLELIKPKDVTYLSFADVLNNYSCNLFEFERIQDEINTAFISIMDLLKKGVNPADIILITDICNNFFFLNTYANEYKIPLNFSVIDLIILSLILSISSVVKVLATG